MSVGPLNITSLDPKERIKQLAFTHGFLDCRISKASFLEKEAPLFEKWLKHNSHGEMRYMENYFDKRLDPRLLVEGSKTIISLSYNYFPKEQQQQDDNYKISKYAYGEDYHKVIKEKLKHILSAIQLEIGLVSGRVFVDSAPVLEKAWAAKSGLGWVGKNTNLITKKQGSFFFLAEMILDINLEPDLPVSDHCGKCTACIDACPTDALTPYRIDAKKCISYLTIELRDSIPNDFKDQMKDWIYGCDICQDVCPWNRFSTPTREEKFAPNKEILNFRKKDWEELTNQTFLHVFKRSAVQRTKFEGLSRNIQFSKSK